MKACHSAISMVLRKDALDNVSHAIWKPGDESVIMTIDICRVFEGRHRTSSGVSVLHNPYLLKHSVHYPCPGL